MLKIVAATHNAGKLKEISEKLKGYPIELVSLLDYPQIPEVEETGKSFYDNALLKATAVSHYTNLPVLADDSGLEIDYLKGKPGIYSARWGTSDGERIAKVLKELQGVVDSERTAHFVCVMCLVIPEHRIFSAEGVCNGIIVSEPQGSSGFGYDPIFKPEGFDLTFSQLGVEIKNKMSHRARALERITPLIITYFHLA